MVQQSLPSGLGNSGSLGLTHVLMSVPDCPWFGRWQENLPPMKWTHCLKNTLHVMELLNDLSEELSLTSDIVNSLPINPLSSVIVCSCLSPVCDSDCESEFQ